MIQRPSRSARVRSGRALVCLLVLVATTIPATAATDEPVVRGDAELEIAADGSVRVDGLFAGDAAEVAGRRAAAEALDADSWRDILRVVARDPLRSDDGDDLPALLGSFQLTESGLRFEPRFPPASGLLLEARFDRSRWNQQLDDDLPAGQVSDELRLAPKDAKPDTRVVAVYPSGDTVPSNLLRFYVQFSAPMGARHVLPHVRLLRGDGSEVPTAFVEVQGGLWDPERTRLTLFVHPGRVKRGVGPNQALGPVLEEGKTYRLHVDAEARDARGLPLVEAYEKTFTVGEADHASPDPESWKLTPPESPDEPLAAELKEPADVALLHRLPSVHAADGKPVPGTVDVASDGRSFVFRPLSPWRAGSYELRVPTALEDPSGNRVDRLFEEQESGEATGGEGRRVDLPFRVTPR